MPVAAVLPILALAAAGTATGLEVSAASDERQKMQDALDQTLAAQRKYQQSANVSAAESLAKGGPGVAKKEIGQGTQDLLSKYNAITSVPLTQPGQQNAPTTSLVPDKGTQMQNAQSNQARAALGGYNEWELQQWIKDLQTQQQLATASTLAKMTSSQLPYQLWQAQNADAGQAALGQGIGAAGSLAGAFATNQPGGFFGAFKGANPGLTPQQIATGQTAPNYNPGQSPASYTMPQG